MFRAAREYHQRIKQSNTPQVQIINCFFVVYYFVRFPEDGPLRTETCMSINRDIMIWTYQENLSQYLTNLMHKICFTIRVISCLYMFRAHVLETCTGTKQNFLWNKFCASSWLNTEINIVRWTVSKTSEYQERFRAIFFSVVNLLQII